jgi:hypothetical protein
MRTICLLDYLPFSFLKSSVCAFKSCKELTSDLDEYVVCNKCMNSRFCFSHGRHATHSSDASYSADVHIVEPVAGDSLNASTDLNNDEDSFKKHGDVGTTSLKSPSESCMTKGEVLVASYSHHLEFGTKEMGVIEIDSDVAKDFGDGSADKPISLCVVDENERGHTQPPQKKLKKSDGNSQSQEEGFKVCENSELKRKSTGPGWRKQTSKWSPRMLELEEQGLLSLDVDGNSYQCLICMNNETESLPNGMRRNLQVPTTIKPQQPFGEGKWNRHEDRQRHQNSLKSKKGSISSFFPKQNDDNKVCNIVTVSNTSYTPCPGILTQTSNQRYVCVNNIFVS